MTRNALVIFALEVVRAAADIGAQLRRLIITVWTLSVSIAEPGLLDAGELILAHVLTVRTHQGVLGRDRRTSLLVGAVGAVQVAVAAPPVQDAGLGGAGELVLRAGPGRALGLVRVVAAVIVAVAHPAALHAAPVAARELLGAARLIARLLVRAVAAVVVAVAHPRQRHALAVARPARELLLRARLLSAHGGVLVRSVRAVRLAVALPVAHDAGPVRAPEVRLAALVARAHSFAEQRVLVGAVAAVVLALALPHVGDAAPVLALEHGLVARPVREDVGMFRLSSFAGVRGGGRVGGG